jgi:hypothetical protein
MTRKKKLVADKQDVTVEAYVQTPKINKLKNISTRNQRVFGLLVKPGGLYELTEQNKKDPTGNARIENAVKQGALEWQ